MYQSTFLHNLTVPAELSVEENMLLGLLRGKNKSLKKASSNLLRRRFQQLLSSLNMGLDNQLAQPVGLLSGGQRQAINLLIATMEPSKILLLDEHTAALDPIAAKMVLTLTEQLVKQHQLTVLMITHNLTDALQYGNKIIMMQNGEIKRAVGKEEKH
jgi:putative ABC transport system ATP-binding protein